MAKVVFFARVSRRKLLQTVEFYKQDIDILQDMGHDVIIATRLRDIPLHYDYIYIWWWTYAAIPVLISKLLGRTSIVTGVFNFRIPAGGQDYFARPLWQRLLMRYAVKHADINLFVSQHERVLCEEYFQLNNTMYCPLVLHDDYLQGPVDNRDLALLTIAWSSKNNLIRKGVPIMLEALGLLKRRGFNIPAYIAGHEGDGVGWLRELIEQYDVEENVELLGELCREEKISRLRRCELYVQPSFYEGFGLAQAEAMGSGACVITCGVGAVEEVVGRAGVYVEPGNAVDLADAIEGILGERELRRRYQAMAVERMRDKFTIDRKGRVFRRIFKEAEER